MRLDKFLKVSRIVKRRTVANEMCSLGRVLINDKVAKPGSVVKSGDRISIQFGNYVRSYEVLEVNDNVLKENAANLYREI